jgi:TonB family protein
MKFMKYLLVLLVLLASLPCIAEPLVITGKSGVPIKVQDESGNWSQSIGVYSDADVEIFIPDIAAEEWKSSHIAKFRQDETYVVPLLLFFKNQNSCINSLPPDQRSNADLQKECRELRYKRELLVVDTQKTTFETVMITTAGKDASFHPESQVSLKTIAPISSANEPVQNAISQVSSLVKKELKDRSATVLQPPPPQQVGGGISPPIVTSTVLPEFSHDRQPSKASGVVLVGLWIDTNGIPANVHVTRSGGTELDNSAVAAVKQYRFKPAMKDGHPIVVELNINVNFQSF